ncbi:hypothetical protein BsIDN1_19800 [Bacillus safensis]|uniref:Uncharacterized protein n=1 Tax=Bacillus safensis TaxID=561879 RepID=A0A5S9M6W7_BACIA|nr:hypothetical protein BsIDN1_19800 [Bacillus safensis]
MGTHLHITAWVLGIILFFVAFALAGKNDKGAKIVHMIVRLFYLIIIATGVELYVRTGMKIPGSGGRVYWKNDSRYPRDRFHGNGPSAQEKRKIGDWCVDWVYRICDCDHSSRFTSADRFPYLLI